MIETTITDNNLDHFAVYAEALQKAPDITAQIVNKTINDHADELLARLREKPGAVKYPIIWTSDRQRKWFWAQVRAGKIKVPYQRTDEMINSWHVVVVYDANAMTSIEVLSDSTVHQFVTGSNQQGYHAATGWYQEQDVLQTVQDGIVDAIETDLVKLLYVIEDYAESH